MSKSKIIPQEKPAEKKAPVLKRIFAADDGLLRAPWLLLIGCAAYLLWNRGISWGLGSAFSALFDLWGVNAANLHLAPAWARVVVNHYGSAVSLVSSAGVIAIAVLLCRFGLREKPGIRFSGRDLGIGSAVGAVVVAASVGLFLLVDSMRVDPQNVFGADAVTFLPVCIAAACAEELFCRAFVIKAIVRGRCEKRAACLTACIVSALILTIISGALSLGVVGAINLLLIGFVCAALHLAGHAWASVGFRFAWSLFSTAVFCFPGGNAVSAPVMSLYHVSDAWLTGGNGGLICGMWMTFVILAAAGILLFSARRRKTI